MFPPFCQFYKKVVIRLSEHGGVIETQTIGIVPPLKFFSKLGTWYVVTMVLNMKLPLMGSSELLK